MADLEIGADSNLTTALATTDRITITRAATGQKVATMTIAEFMKKCAAMMPTATASANGLMGSTDRRFHPESYNIRNHYIFTNMEADTFMKFKVNGSCSAIITLSAGWNTGNTTGQIIKSISCSSINSQTSFVIGANQNTAILIYVSDLLIDNDNSLYFYIANKSGKRDLSINISFMRGDLSDYESMGQPPGYTTSLNNYNDYKSQ